MSTEEAEQFVDRFARRDLSEWPIDKTLGEAFQITAQLRAHLTALHQVQSLHCPNDARGIVIDQSCKEQQQRLCGRPIEATYLAIVDYTEHLTRHGKEVARVGIAMEEAVAEDLGQDQLQTVACKTSLLDSRCCECHLIIDLHPVEAFTGQHPIIGIVPVDLWDVDGRVIGKEVAKTVGIAPLTSIVQFGP